METSKSRKTQIIAHVSKSVLQRKFPDTVTEDKLYIEGEFLDTYGDPIETKMSFNKWSNKDNVLVQALKRAGIPYEIREETRQYAGYVRFELEDGSRHDLTISTISELKTGINFVSSLDEKEHYEKVDAIIKELAKKDVAVLDGECEITITTRC